MVCFCKAFGSPSLSCWRICRYLTDMRFRGAITEVRDELLGEPYPAATMVQVSALADENWLVEIEAIVALD